MKLNLTNSFVYMFKDKSWILKFVCIIGLFIISACAIMSVFSSMPPSPETFEQIFYKKIFLFLLSYFLMFIILGNIALNTNRRIHEKSDLLYEWRGNFLKTVSASVPIYVIAIIICVLYYKFNMYNFERAMHDSDSQAAMSRMYIFHYGMLFLYLLGYLSFVRDLKFTSFFNIPAIIKILTKNYGIAIIMLILIQLLLLFSMAYLGKITYGLAIIILLPYVLYVISDINAQYIKYVFESDEKDGK